MLNWLERLAQRIWPGLGELPPDRRLISSIDVVGTLYVSVLAAVGLAWLALSSNWRAAAEAWQLCVVLLLLLIPLNRFSFFALSELRPGMTSSVASSLDAVVDWTAALLLGPVGLWFGVLSSLTRLGLSLRGEGSGSARWATLRSEIGNLADNTLARMAALSVYSALGGRMPFPGFSPRMVLLALLATLLMFVFQQLLAVPLYYFLGLIMRVIDPSIAPKRLFGFVIGSAALLAAGTPFAVLAAGLYVEYGLWLLIFFFAGVVLSSYLAHNFSRTALRSQQQSRLMEGLESLGRELLLAPPEEDVLLERIREHIMSSKLHLPGRVEVRLFPERLVLHSPEMWTESISAAWDWLRVHPGTHHFRPGGTTPWGEENRDRCTALVSIDDYDTGQMIGGIYQSTSTRGYIDPELFTIYLPVLDSLADQVALALRRVQNYTRLVSHQRVEQELRVAGDIQGSFLPDRFPEVAGWWLSGVLVSARDTSGDFFDFFAVPDGRVAVVVADVADKGVGAALYMALSRAYLRSQAMENDPDPAKTITALNRRILVDTSSDLFVTVFYGLVGPNQDEFVYANAGHPPPILVRADSALPVEFMPRTGMVVGVMPESTWEAASVHLNKGDFIVIYSDGITDAQNDAGQDFGLARLVIEAEGMRGRPPAEVRQHLIDVVQAFSGSYQEDDITLLVLGKASED